MRCRATALCRRSAAYAVCTPSTTPARPSRAPLYFTIFNRLHVTGLARRRAAAVPGVPSREMAVVAAARGAAAVWQSPGRCTGQWQQQGALPAAQGLVSGPPLPSAPGAPRCAHPPPLQAWQEPP